MKRPLDPMPSWFSAAVKELFAEDDCAQYTPAAGEAWWSFLGGIPSDRLADALERCPRPVSSCEQIRDYTQGKVSRGGDADLTRQSTVDESEAAE